MIWQTEAKLYIIHFGNVLNHNQILHQNKQLFKIPVNALKCWECEYYEKDITLFVFQSKSDSHPFYANCNDPFNEDKLDEKYLKECSIPDWVCLKASKA